jgi:hypothetical protein
MATVSVKASPSISGTPTAVDVRLSFHSIDKSADYEQSQESAKELVHLGQRDTNPSHVVSSPDSWKIEMSVDANHRTYLIYPLLQPLSQMVSWLAALRRLESLLVLTLVADATALVEALKGMFEHLAKSQPKLTLAAGLAEVINDAE